MTSSKCPLCSQQSCPVSASLRFDEDWFADLDDFLSDPEFHHRLWRLFANSETKAELGPDVVKYETKLDRCQQLADKWPQIEAQIEASRHEHSKFWGFPEVDIPLLNTNPSNDQADVVGKVEELGRKLEARMAAVRKKRNAGEVTIK